MTDLAERRISYRELVLLAFTCKRCRAELTLDIREEEQKQKLSHLQCPFCKAEFDRYLWESFNIFDEWRKRIEVSGHEVIFRIHMFGGGPVSE